MTPPDVTIFPAQASRIAAVAIQTGTVIGLSQSGSTITIHTGKEEFSINAQGNPIIPGPDQEQLPC